MVATQKPLASAMSEVTVTIQKKTKENYHETFLLDISKDNIFEYEGQSYNIPCEDTGHYFPSFWDFPQKWGAFFEKHKTLAHFDFFNFRSRACYEIGYLYNEGVADPFDLVPPEIDWATVNYGLQHNTTIEGAMKDADSKLKGSHTNVSGFMLIMAIVVAIVAVIVVVSFMTGNHHPAAQAIQNATLTATPTPIPGHVRIIPG